MEGLILVIEPSTLTDQGDSCLALSAKFRLGDSPAGRGQVGSPPWVHLMALIGTKQSCLHRTLLAQAPLAQALWLKAALLEVVKPPGTP